MKSYKVKTILKKFGESKTMIVEDIMVLDDSDTLKDYVQMSYGSFRDIISFSFIEIEPVLISKNYIKNVAKRMIRFV